MAPDHPEWKSQQPFQAVLEGDMKALAASGEKGLIELVMTTHAGMTTDEFVDIVKKWIQTAQHPTLNKPLIEAETHGWTVVDMKKEWKVIYP